MGSAGTNNFSARKLEYLVQQHNEVNSAVKANRVMVMDVGRVSVNLTFRGFGMQPAFEKKEAENV